MNATPGSTVSLTIQGRTHYGELVGSSDTNSVVRLYRSGEVVNTPTANLKLVHVCGCATLEYRPQWGPNAGQLFTTGCVFDKKPSPGSTFLPGHDAKAKSFLIRAALATDTLENGKNALETARELSDKIALAVAKGMDRARENSRKRTVSRRKGSQTNRPEQPARREDELDDVDRLQRKLGVTEPMFEALAYGVTNDLHPGVAQGKTGTLLALMDRKLTVAGGGITDLGYQVMRQPTLVETDPDKVICTDDLGSYSKHLFHYKPSKQGSYTARVCIVCDHEAGDWE